MLNKVEYINSLNTNIFEFLKNYTQIGVLVDENTKLHCYSLIKNFLPPHFLIEIQSGEENKHLETCVLVWQKMTDFQFDRKAVLLNLGGGVIGDLGGFCASTYKRGIDFYQMPTTLLSQVDASVGGKLGVDFQQFKNHIGVFNIPKNVLIYPDFIKTLSFRELRSGYAEVLKHCLIADKEEWKSVTQKTIQEQNWSKIIPHSVKIKSNVVEQDPKESGLRKILNFGHTIGHAVESYFLQQGLNKKLLHGEAIAIGMIAEAYLSHLKCGLTLEEVNEISSYFLMTYGKVSISDEELSQMYEYMLQDKKNEGKSVRFALLPKIGDCLFDIEANRVEIEKSMKYYQKL
jgi:3-dehydroquinate synthase